MLPYEKLNQSFKEPKKGHLGFDLVGIGQLLREESHLQIPIYQRSFAWEQGQINDYWNDITGAMIDATEAGNFRADYFMGSIVLTPGDEAEDEELFVIDGQQRLITTTLLFCAIRDKFDALEMPQAVEQVSQNYLIDATGFQLTERKPKLSLQDDLDEFFQTAIVATPAERVAEAEIDSQAKARLEAAFNHLVDLVDKFSEAQADEEAAGNALAILTSFVVSNVRVLRLEASSQANAYMIFETLNDRGADLTTFDLLKNFLFGRAALDSEDRLRRVMRSWERAVNNLEVAESKWTDFLRQHWSSKHGHTPERTLYSKMKAELDTPAKIGTYAGSLNKGAKLYSAIENPGNPFWNELSHHYRKRCQNAIGDLASLEATQMRPLLLAILEQWEDSPSQIAEALEALVNWHVRVLVAGDAGGGAVEKTYCRLAVDVRNPGAEQGIADCAALKEDTRAMALVPDDTSFQERFEVYTISPSKPKIGRYLLASLHSHTEGEALPVNSDPGIVNLEHIFPKSPEDGEWEVFPDERRKELLNRVGNLTLLHRDDNHDLVNAPYDQKVVVYGESEIPMTRQLADDYDEWTPETVSSRQKAQAELVAACWPK